EMSEKLDSPELLQLVQRVRLRFHLTALSAEDLRAYVLHRLEVAGSQGRPLFAEETFPTIYLYTGGIPRLINTLCDTALMAAFATEKREVGLDEIRSAIEELGWVDYASRTARLQALQARTAAEPARAGDFARIVVSFDGARVEERVLVPGRVVIGRTPDNDLQIDSKFVSRHHCQIVTTPDGSTLEDLNSTNGVYVKSKRVRRRHLNDGDVIALGRHEILYLDQRAGRGRNPNQDTGGDGGD
ncbi:MAG TPA: FHA domain-containing protein, partial [Pseudomonadales bacterium]|nr:FHA domain-containing protein [Pseudomonadales bacterium]